MPTASRYGRRFRIARALLRSADTLTPTFPAAGRLRATLALGALLLAALAPRLAAGEPPALLSGLAPPAASAPAGMPTAESIAAHRAAIQVEIAATRAELAKLPDGVPANAASWLTQETALLERIDAIFAEQQRAWQHAADLAVEGANVEENTRNRRPPEATFQPPYNLALLDQLYSERDDLEQATASLLRDVELAETMVREARDVLEEKHRERRAARGNANAADSAGKSTGNLRLAELESRLAQETLLLREKTLQTLRLQQSLLEPKQKLLRPRFEWLRKNLALGPAPSPTAQDARATELDRAIAATRTYANAATQFVISTERRAATEPIAEELESRRANRQTANLTLSVLTAQRERLAEKARVAELRRRVLLGEMSAADLRTLARENKAAIGQLDSERRRNLTELIRNRRELREWQSRLTLAAAADTRAPPWSVERVKRLSAWIDLSQAEMTDRDGIRTARSRLQEEIGTRINLFSWSDSTALGREKIVAAWNYELFAVQDQPVRIKTVLSVLLLVVLGYHASRWVSAQVSHRVFKRFGMNTGRRAAWQALWFYALFVVVLVVAFNRFHISLTQFSVVSGALAVGIGFGSQNLISNFISGLILLIERPVNQGDVIEIDGRRVTVEQLGVRSTIVRTLDNTHMVVPNSRLLEQPVINWTLSDEVVRQQFRVGVAYGSPTRRVAELLEAVLQGVEAVRKEPAPLVIFADFGESALLFDLYFWASIADRFESENELRHRIAEVFAREKIIMAFPQRDVHLETTKPLHVVITPPAGPDDGKSRGGVASL